MFHLQTENLDKFPHSSVMERLKSKVAKKIHADRVLVLSPHPDDDALGCGGLLIRLSHGGAHIKCLYIYDGASGNKEGKRDVSLIEKREKESIEAAKVLGVSEVNYQRAKEGEAASKIGGRIYEELRVGRYDLILLPSDQEWHRDHINVARAGEAAIRRMKKAPTAWAYNVWGLSIPEIVIPINAEIKKKIEAAKAHKSQLKVKDYEGAIVSINRYLGESLGVSKYAEVYGKL